MSKIYSLNRKMYKNIRKMDHNQMSGFLENLYKEGYADGQKETECLKIDEVKEVLLSVKGIGEKKTDDIISAIEDRMNMKKPIEKE